MTTTSSFRSTGVTAALSVATCPSISVLLISDLPGSACVLWNDKSYRRRRRDASPESREWGSCDRSRELSLFSSLRSAGSLPVEGHVPAFDGATGWLNSTLLTSADLQGKVV